MTRRLRALPFAVAALVAARAAARAAPMIWTGGPARSHDRVYLAQMLPAIGRAIAVARVAATWPDRALVDAAANAYATAYDVAHDAGAVGDARKAAEAGVQVAAAAFFVHACVDDAFACLDKAIAAACDVDGAIAEAVAADLDGLTDDIHAVDRRPAAVHALAAAPLWPGAAPATIAEAWRDLAAVLHSAGDDWPVWADWYQRLLNGGLEPAEAALAFVDHPEQDWLTALTDPAHVNARIRQALARL